MAVKVVVQFKVREDSQAAFESIMRSVATDLPAVAGCTNVEVLQQSDDAGRFVLVETWDSREVHQSHVNGLVADGTWASLATHLAEDPVTGYFRSI
ncbi:putative quinol monooxygenase [Roseibium sp.]|uniref:putative quinol monooxygenase n=1 Tax=Roseibium sp. TaxID=1936156 RepID=UPI003D0CAD97